MIQGLNDMKMSISGATNARISGSYLNVYLDNILIDKINLPSVSSEYIRVEKKIKIIEKQGVNSIYVELIRNSPDTKFFLDSICHAAYYLILLLTLLVFNFIT